MVIDSTFCILIWTIYSFAYSYWPFFPSWLKIVTKFCSIAAKIDSYMFMVLSSSLCFFVCLFVCSLGILLSIIATVGHIKDYKYRALLSWSLGSFKYKLSERYPFCRLGFFVSIQLFLFCCCSQHHHCLLMCHDAAPVDKSKIASNLSSNMIIRDQVSQPVKFYIWGSCLFFPSLFFFFFLFAPSKNLSEDLLIPVDFLWCSLYVIVV